MDRCMIKIDEGLKKSFVNVQKSVNRMCSHNLDSEYPMETVIDESFSETISNMDGLINALQDIFPNGIRDMIDFDSVKVMGAKLSEAVDAYASHEDQSHQLSKLDFSLIFLMVFINAHFFKDLISVAYKVTQEESYRIMYEDNPAESGFSDVEELVREISKCINNNMISCEEFAGWTQNKKRQYIKVWQILFFLCACFMQLHIKQDIGLPVKADKAVIVRKQPNQSAETVCLLKDNAEAIILEDVIRYYKIVFIDEEGIKKEGYVSKRGVKPIYGEI